MPIQGNMDGGGTIFEFSDNLYIIYDTKYNVSTKKIFSLKKKKKIHMSLKLLSN